MRPPLWVAALAAVALSALPAAARGFHHGGGFHHDGGGFHHGFGGPHVFIDAWGAFPFAYPYPYPYPYPYYVPSYPYPGYPYPPPPPDDAGWSAPPPEGQSSEDEPATPDATYGLLQLRGVPDGAQLDLDGRFWLTAAQLDHRWLALPQGTHQLRIRVRGADPVERRVDVSAGKTQVVRVGPLPRSSS